MTDGQYIPPPPADRNELPPFHTECTVVHPFRCMVRRRRGGLTWRRGKSWRRRRRKRCAWEKKWWWREYSVDPVPPSFLILKPAALCLSSSSSFPFSFACVTSSERKHSHLFRRQIVRTAQKLDKIKCNCQMLQQTSCIFLAFHVVMILIKRDYFKKVIEGEATIGVCCILSSFWCFSL